MFSLEAFGQSNEKPIRALKLDGMDAHKREESLVRIFRSAGFELAKPRSVPGGVGGRQIEFLSSRQGLSEVNALGESDPIRQAADRLFLEREATVLRLGKKNGVPHGWLEQILRNSKLYTDGDQHLCLVWGLEFEPEDVYRPIVRHGIGEEEKEKSGDEEGQRGSEGIGEEEQEVIVDPIDEMELGKQPATLEARQRSPWWPWLTVAAILCVLAILLLCLDGCNGDSRSHLHYSPVTGRTAVNPLPGFTPDTPNNMEPISEGDIMDDPETGGRIAKGRVNTYPKRRNVDFPKYLRALQAAISDPEISVTDYCMETRRVQFDIGEGDYHAFAELLKLQMSEYDLLVWPERIFEISSGSVNASSRDGWHLEAINAEGGWQLQTGSPSITVAVVDSGFDLNHPDLDQDTTFNYHVPYRDRTVYANSGIIHGTHVAGLAIGEPTNAIGTAGVAHGCSWMPVQLSSSHEEEGLSSTHIVDGILYAMNHGADVINLSLGSSIQPDYFVDESGAYSLEHYFAVTRDEASFWNELYAIGEQTNTLFVIAAGNDAVPLELDPMHRSNLPIYVAATDRSGRLAEEFSNFPSGTRLLDAPVVCVAAPGDGILSCAVGGDAIEMPGTSMACPQVAGAAGLVRSANPQLRNEEIRSLFASLPSTVSTVDMENWFLLSTLPPPIAGRWTMDAEKESPERIELKFQEDGTFQCTQCNDEYARGNWRMNATAIEVIFRNGSAVTCRLTGAWEQDQFEGELVMTIDNEQGLFRMKPVSNDWQFGGAGQFPFLDLEVLLLKTSASESLI